MNIKSILTAQYQSIVDRAAVDVHNLTIPPEGWLCTARKALNMSGAQLARRLGVSRAQVSNTEKREVTGNVTLKTMQQMAQTMGYRFVYTIVPEKSVEEIIKLQALKKAQSLIEQTNQHMALEGQTLSEKQLKFEVKRLQNEMLSQPPFDLWENDD